MHFYYRDFSTQYTKNQKNHEPKLASHNINIRVQQNLKNHELKQQDISQHRLKNANLTIDVCLHFGCIVGLYWSSWFPSQPNSSLFLLQSHLSLVYHSHTTLTYNSLLQSLYLYKNSGESTHYLSVAHHNWLLMQSDCIFGAKPCNNKFLLCSKWPTFSSQTTMPNSPNSLLVLWTFCSHEKTGEKFPYSWLRKPKQGSKLFLEVKRKSSR